MSWWRNPTALLFSGAVLLGAFTVAGYLVGVVPAWVAVALDALVIYLGFTVLHESTHRVAHRATGVNSAMGWIAGLPLMATYPMFRTVHIQHHSHTNDAAVDPDFAAGAGPFWVRPAMLLSPLWEYRAKWYGRRWFKNRRQLFAQLALDLGVLAGLVVAAVTGHLGPVVVLWLLPYVLASMVLVYFFDYVPHRPYDQQGRFFDTASHPGRVANVLLLGQNYHAIHHAWNTVPWWRYQQVFADTRGDLETMGAWRAAGLPGSPRPPSADRGDRDTGDLLD
jgi:beta-carotene hydroxylase